MGLNFNKIAKYKSQILKAVNQRRAVQSLSKHHYDERSQEVIWLNAHKLGTDSFSLLRRDRYDVFKQNRNKYITGIKNLLWSNLTTLKISISINHF